MTSVQENYNVEMVFQYLATEYTKKLKEREELIAKTPVSVKAQGHASTSYVVRHMLYVIFFTSHFLRHIFVLIIFSEALCCVIDSIILFFKSVFPFSTDRNENFKANNDNTTVKLEQPKKVTDLAYYAYYVRGFTQSQYLNAVPSSANGRQEVVARVMHVAF